YDEGVLLWSVFAGLKQLTAVFRQQQGIGVRSWLGPHVHEHRAPALRDLAHEIQLRADVPHEGIVEPTAGEQALQMRVGAEHRREAVERELPTRGCEPVALEQAGV